MACKSKSVRRARADAAIAVLRGRCEKARPAKDHDKLEMLRAMKSLIGARAEEDRECNNGTFGLLSLANDQDVFTIHYTSNCVSVRRRIAEADSEVRRGSL